MMVCIDYGDDETYENVREKFLCKVEMTDNCWNWVGSKDNNGYGTLCFHGVSWRAHRFSYALHKGKFSMFFNVLHKCDNPACVNPNHLYLGTQIDNNRDMVTRGRNFVPYQNSIYKRGNIP